MRTTSDAIAAAGQLSNPTLLIYGEVDHMSDAELNLSLHEVLKGPKDIQEVKEMRHTHLLQHQSKLTNIVKTWLGLQNSENELSEDICPVQEFRL